MKNVLILLFYIIIQSNTFAQNNRETVLVNTLLDYHAIAANNENMEHHQSYSKFNSTLEDALVNENILNFQLFKKITDSLNIHFIIKKSEYNNWLLFTMVDNFFHWNYLIANHKVVLKQNKWHEYFTEIYPLNNKEFLLITRYDELSFSCYKAFVMKQDANYIIKKDAFNPKQDSLMVCTYTNVDQSYVGAKDSVTGLYSVQGGINYYEPNKIYFNPKNKEISYAFYPLKNGKKTIRKSIYKNGKFKIKSYDATTFES